MTERAPIIVEIDHAAIRAALARLRDAAIDPGPVLRAIGERLVETTKRRFETSTGPDGRRWAPNSRVVYEALVSRGKGYLTPKGGRLSAKGARAVMAKKPLIGESKALSTTIAFRVEPGAVVVGSPMEYAAVQQFGAVAGALGRNQRGGPIPWGDIPPRPFLGLSSEDQSDVLEILRDALGGAWGE